MGKDAEDKSRTCSDVLKNDLGREMRKNEEEGCGQPGEISEPPVVWEEQPDKTSKR